MNVIFGECFPFDIIGDIPACRVRMAVMGRNYYSRAYRIGQAIFVHCLLN